MIRTSPAISGQRFGMLIAVKRYEGHGVKWLCRCDCGAESSPTAANLRTGKTRSCGCQVSKGTHRLSIKGRTAPEYKIWSEMVQRCTNPNNKAFRRYGGRGISVCDGWLKFEGFFASMGTRPSPSLSIDRINNDGNYEPGNCRWASRAQQQRNRSVTVLTMDGVRLMRALRASGSLLATLAREFGISEQWTSTICAGKAWREGC